ncbi:MAG: LptF/LptG family permease [Candidatus Omnitrophica bacterium]|nr:LptF/LptG family permease [Candidatus Omnitrophota bacterium]
MKLIDKNIYRELIPAFLFCVALFTFLFVIIDLFANLDDIIKQQVGIRTLIQYYLSFLPSIFTIITPISTLLATLYSLGTLNRQNEIMAMKAGGISTLKIITPFLFMGIIISLLSFIVDSKLVPEAYETYITIKKEHIERGDKKKDKEIIKDVALYGADYRIFYAESYDTKTETLNKLIILQHNETGELVGRITADKAKWTGTKWICYNCIIHRLTSSGTIASSPAFFKEKVIKLQENPRDFSKSKHQTQFMSIFELYKYVKKLSKNGYRPLGVIIDFHNKISFPLISFVVVLIGLPFALIKNKGGTFLYIGGGLAISFFYYVVLIISVSLGKAGLLPPLLASWLANIIFAISGIVLLAKLSK